jgi:hypothetical protein
MTTIPTAYTSAPTPTTRAGWIALARWACKLLRECRGLAIATDLACDVDYFRAQAHRVTL